MHGHTPAPPCIDGLESNRVEWARGVVATVVEAAGLTVLLNLLSQAIWAAARKGTGAVARGRDGRLPETEQRRRASFRSRLQAALNDSLGEIVEYSQEWDVLQAAVQRGIEGRPSFIHELLFSDSHLPDPLHDPAWRNADLVDVARYDQLATALVEAAKSAVAEDEYLAHYLQLFPTKPTTLRLPDFFRGEVIEQHNWQHQPSQEAIEEFLKGGVVTWEIVAADGSVERDQLEEVVQALVQSPPDTRMVCLVGEAAQGKTTLTRQAVVKLCKEHGKVVLHAFNTADGQLWGQLLALYDEIREPFVLLIDDALRDDGFVSMAQYLDLHLPVTILTSAWPADLRNLRRLPSGFRAKVKEIPLAPASAGEKESMARLAGRPVEQMSLEARSRLEAATDFFVLALETTTGESLPQYVERRMRELKQASVECWTAYAYIAWSWAHEISMPESLLASLFPKVREIWGRPELVGLVQGDVARPYYIRGGNPRFCAEAVKAMGLSPLWLTQQLMAAVSPADHRQRRHRVHLLRTLLERNRDLCLAVLNDSPVPIADLISQSGTVMEGFHLGQLLRRVGMRTEGMRCLQYAATIRPQSYGDLLHLSAVLRELSETHLLGDRIREYLSRKPDSGSARALHLSALLRSRDATPLTAALDDTERWLRSHGEDVIVRCQWLALVQVRGDKPQWQWAIEQTSQWLKESAHAHDVVVRCQWLALVQVRGDRPQWQSAIKQTRKWLEEPAHAHDVMVRVQWLTLTQEHGTSGQQKSAVRQTDRWLQAHPEDNYLRARWLALVGACGTPEQQEAAIDRTSEWLQRHLEDTNVRTCWLALVETCGTPEQLQAAVAQTSQWLKHHPDDTSVRTRWLALVEACWSREQREAALTEISKWVRDRANRSGLLDWSDVLTRYLAFLCAFGDTNVVDDALRLTEKVMGKALPPEDVFGGYLALLRSRPDARVCPGAVVAWGLAVIARNPRDDALYVALGAWLRENGLREQARAILVNAANLALRSFGARYAYGQLLLDDQDYAAAENEFRQVLKIHKGHQLAHGGLAWALARQGRLDEAVAEAKHAIYWARENRANDEARFRDPTARFHTSLGWFYLEQGALSQAMDEFETAMADDPSHFINWWGKARVSKATGRVREARYYARVALGLASEDLGPPASDEIPALIDECSTILRGELRRPS